jgi:hypothetical protein
VKPMTKAIAVALIQILTVSSLGAKLLYDRRTRPQAWFKTARYDPNLPIRGRYVSLQIEVKDSRSAREVESKFADELRVLDNGQSRFNRFSGFGRECGSIELMDGAPVAVFDDSPASWSCDNLTFDRWRPGPEYRLRLAEPILFFISDTAQDPTGLNRDQELWVLATIPRKGPPRPIALGIKKAGEQDIRPLAFD